MDRSVIERLREAVRGEVVAPDDATAPLSEEGGYINVMAEDHQDRIRANYKDNYDRLAGIKRKYDPANIFRFNQNIQPA